MRPSARRTLRTSPRTAAGITNGEKGLAAIAVLRSPRSVATVPVVIPQKGHGTPERARNGQMNGIRSAVLASRSPAAIRAPKEPACNTAARLGSTPLVNYGTAG